MNENIKNYGSFICPVCGEDAASGYVWKVKYYCPTWQEAHCINCNEKLIPNLGTKRFIIASFFIGFTLDVVLSWLTPWDRAFDMLFAIAIALPFILGRKIFTQP